MGLIFADAEGQKVFRVTASYQDHLNRKPPSIDPGEDWGTGDGTGLFSIRPGGIINNWIGSNNIAITSVTYNDLKLRFEFLHVRPRFEHPSGYHLAPGELMALTSNSGIDPATGKPYPFHVHINVYVNATIADDGTIGPARKGTRVDPKGYTQDINLVLKPIPPSIDYPAIIKQLQTENADLKNRLQQINNLSNIK